MITLQAIDENNMMEAMALGVKPEQREFVASPTGILARAYAYRRQRAVCWGIYAENRMVGLALLCDLPEEPACYHLMELLIDASEQGKGYGSAALRLILAHCRREGKFPTVEICVKKNDAAAIHVYEKAGFRDTGYIDPATPDSLNLAYELPPQFHSPMEIKFRDICLRDMRKSDIDDEIRWNTVETEWALWDAPWEMEVELPKFDPAAYRREAEKALQKPPEGFRWEFELDTAAGVHIGSVNSYLIDENWEWISLSSVKPGQKTYRTLGIEINEHRFWSGGLGTQALAAFVRYHLEHGYSELCLQTWSGNVRMIRCAQRLGFVECHREIGSRNVRGKIYDGLTFLLDVARFQDFLAENP